MKEKRRLDEQGRIIIPNHMRKGLNLGPGSLVEVTMDDDHTIQIKPADDNCCICGKSLKAEDAISISKTKSMCKECAEAIAKVI